MRDCFEDAARAFSKEHGRPATLVIDGVEFLSVDPALMKSLVTFAKVGALVLSPPCAGPSAQRGQPASALIALLTKKKSATASVSADVGG